MEKNITELNTTRKIIEKDLVKCLNKFGSNLCYLKSRWNDEKEYEDFKQYKKQLKLIFEKFNFKVEHCDKKFHIVLIHKVGDWCTDVQVKSSEFSYGFSKLVTKTLH